MKTTLRRTATALCTFVLILCTSGCWLLGDAPNLWQTSHLGGMQNRGQDFQYMTTPERTTERGGW